MNQVEFGRCGLVGKVEEAGANFSSNDGDGFQLLM
jgi:hypothetical protein